MSANDFSNLGTHREEVSAGGQLNRQFLETDFIAVTRYRTGQLRYLHGLTHPCTCILESKPQQAVEVCYSQVITSTLWHTHLKTEYQVIFLAFIGIDCISSANKLVALLNDLSLEKVGERVASLEILHLLDLLNLMICFIFIRYCMKFW